MSSEHHDYAAEIAAERAAITEINAAIRKVERIGGNLPEAMQRAAAYAQRAHAQGAEIIRRAGQAAAAGRDIGEAFRPHTQWDRVDLGPILAVLMGAETFAELVSANIADYAKPGPDAAQRAADLAELQRQLLEAERREEDLVVRSESTRAPVLRRPDARPEIVLGSA